MFEMRSGHQIHHAIKARSKLYRQKLIVPQQVRGLPPRASFPKLGMQRTRIAMRASCCALLLAGSVGAFQLGAPWASAAAPRERGHGFGRHVQERFRQQGLLNQPGHVRANERSGAYILVADEAQAQSIKEEIAAA